jgi:uncharacterized membrane protein/glutaredoxin
LKFTIATRDFSSNFTSAASIAMARRAPSAPWAQPLLTGLSLSGAALTGYLTLVKLTGNTAACPTAGCETVLTSRYSEVAGFPLSLLGLGAYLLVAVLANLPSILDQRTAKTQADGQDKDEAEYEYEAEEEASQWQELAWLPLFWLTTAMVTLSGYLLFVLATDLKLVCPYCIASAILSLALWLTTLLGRSWEDWGKLSFDGLLIAFLVGFAAIALNGTSPTLANESGPRYDTAEITTTATPDAIALAKHLSASGATMYGAYWCSHCHDQKARFGQAAALELPYVECDAKGINSQAEQCRAAKIDSYPTWIVNGEVLSGTQDLADLAEASGYNGPRNFSQ